MSVSTVLMMPDGKHLFVSAEGAGYIIDAEVANARGGDRYGGRAE